MADIDAHLRALTEYKDDMMKRETPLPKASAACPVCGLDKPHGHGQEELITLIIKLRADHEAAIQAAALRAVTPEMVKAYLDANTEYWRMQDALPAPVGKWRNGTPNEATEYALTKMFAAIDQARHGGVK